MVLLKTVFCILVLLYILPFVSATPGQLVATNVTNALTADNNLSTAPSAGGSVVYMYSDFPTADTSTIVYFYFKESNDAQLYLEMKNNITGHYDVITTSPITTGGGYWIQAQVPNAYYLPLKVRGAHYYFSAGFNSVIAEIQAWPPIPNGTYPTEGLTIYKDYPPLTTAINFTWELNNTEDYNPPGTSSNIIIAKDAGFNIITSENTIANSYYLAVLEAGTYWYKIRYYNPTSGMYYNWSNSKSFTVTNNQSIAGVGIQGITYELINSAQTTVQGATVYIYNSTWSSNQIVGSNGYYLFTDLANGSLYSIFATKSGYQNSVIELINASGINTRQILMKKTESTVFEPDQTYINLWIHYVNCYLDCNVEGATVNMYKYGESIPYDTQITDAGGSVGFKLFKTQLYNLQITNATGELYSSTFRVNYPDNIYEIKIGNITTSYPNASITPSINVSRYNETYGTKGWGARNLTSANLNSSIGLGIMGQGILVGIINWIVVGAGGILTTIFVSGILVYLGVLSLGTVAFFIITAVALWYIKGQ